MIASFFKAVGVVFTTVLLMVLALVALYMSYILAIGLILVVGVFVVYQFFRGIST